MESCARYDWRRSTDSSGRSDIIAGIQYSRAFSSTVRSRRYSYRPAATTSTEQERIQQIRIDPRWKLPNFTVRRRSKAPEKSHTNEKTKSDQDSFTPQQIFLIGDASSSALIGHKARYILDQDGRYTVLRVPSVTSADGAYLYVPAGKSLDNFVYKCRTCFNLQRSRVGREVPIVGVDPNGNFLGDPDIGHHCECRPYTSEEIKEEIDEKRNLCSIVGADFSDVADSTNFVKVIVKPKRGRRSQPVSINDATAQPHTQRKACTSRKRARHYQNYGSSIDESAGWSSGKMHESSEYAEQSNQSPTLNEMNQLLADWQSKCEQLEQILHRKEEYIRSLTRKVNWYEKEYGPPAQLQYTVVR